MRPGAGGVGNQMFTETPLEFISTVGPWLTLLGVPQRPVTSMSRSHLLLLWF